MVRLHGVNYKNGVNIYLKSIVIMQLFIAVISVTHTSLYTRDKIFQGGPNISVNCGLGVQIFHYRSMRDYLN